MSYNLNNCRRLQVNFIYSDSDPEIKAIEDDIRADLSKIGITATSNALDAMKYWSSDELLQGDYNIRFARTWGAPYDPHSYLTYWTAEGSPTYNDHANLVPPPHP